MNAGRAPLRVCFLTHYFPPEVGAPQSRISSLAKSLADAGLTVTVHTGFPNYPAGKVIAPYRNRPWMVESVDGVRVIRSAVYPAPNAGFARRLANHSASALSALLTGSLSGALDVVVAETPPLFTAAAGVLYARLKRAALLVNVSDRWPTSAVELGALRNRRAIRLASALEAWIYRHGDLLTAPTAGLTSALEMAPEARGKCRRVWPVVDVDRFDPTPGPSLSGGRPLRALYAGTVGLAQGLEVLVEASRTAGPGVVQTIIAGDGAQGGSLRDLIERQAVANVQMVGSVASDQIPPLYAQADVGVVLLRDVPLFRAALPTKMFETMAAGRPVVLAARGEAAKLIEEIGAGLVVPPEDPQALAGAMRRLHSEPELIRRMGMAGRQFVELRCGRARAAAQWIEQLQEAADRSSLRP